MTQPTPNESFAMPPQPDDWTPPLPNTYWVEPGRLLAGEYPRHFRYGASVDKLRKLLDAGIDTFIDLTEARDRLEPYRELACEVGRECNRCIEVMHFPIRDLAVPHSPEHMRAILDAIEAAMSAEQTVYVHCWGGVGRTGTVIGCYLAEHGYPGAAALAQLAALWKKCGKSSAGRASPETDTQRAYVMRWPGR